MGEISRWLWTLQMLFVCVCVNVKTKVFIADSIMFIWRMIGIWMMTIIDDDNYVDDDNETAL